MATPAAPPLEWHRKNMESIRYQMQRKAGDPVFPPQQ
jgi:hypothetical protein